MTREKQKRKRVWWVSWGLIVAALVVASIGVWVDVANGQSTPVEGVGLLKPNLHRVGLIPDPTNGGDTAILSGKISGKVTGRGRYTVIADLTASGRSVQAESVAWVVVGPGRGVTREFTLRWSVTKKFRYRKNARVWRVLATFDVVGPGVPDQPVTAVGPPATYAY